MAADTPKDAPQRCKADSSQPIELWCNRCGCLMVLRRGKFGEFWGCTGYPQCFHTMSVRDAGNQHDPPNDPDDWEGEAGILYDDQF